MLAGCVAEGEEDWADEELGEAEQAITVPTYSDKQEVLIDFGTDLSVTPVAPYYDVWNDAQGMRVASTTTLALKDSDGWKTGYTYRTSNTWGYTSTAGPDGGNSTYRYPGFATTDLFYGYTTGTGSAPKASMEFAGLHTTVTYTFDLFCSFTASDGIVRETQYTLTGATVVSGHDNCTNNTTRMTLSVKPNSSGKITIDIAEYAALNTHPNGAYHINNVRMTWSPPFGTDTPRYSNVTMGGALPPKGYYEYLPSRYNVDTARTWPVIISFHGWGELGDGTSGTNGLGQLNAAGTGLQASIDDGTFKAHDKFIVISPQDIESGGYMLPSETDALITWIRDHYRADMTRIYLVGLSYGGRVTWDYINAYGPNSRVAAAVATPGDGAYNNPLNCSYAGQTPLWSFHGLEDGINGRGDPNSITTLARVKAAVKAVNECGLTGGTAPVEPFKLTVWDTKTSNPHHIWDVTYLIPGSQMNASVNWTTVSDPLYTSYSQNIYDWLLAHKN
jgi:poly(3-hydroxybutyrate) depolymerase